MGVHLFRFCRSFVLFNCGLHVGFSIKAVGGVNWWVVVLALAVALVFWMADDKGRY